MLLAILPPATKELIRAAELCRVCVRTVFIRALPHGYDTVSPRVGPCSPQGKKRSLLWRAPWRPDPEDLIPD